MSVSVRRTLPSDRRHLLEQFTLVQVARKVVGVGSVGTRAWIVLMDAGDGAERAVDRPVELQHRRAQDPDDHRRVHGGQEHRRPEEAPARDLEVDRIGYE